MKRLNSDPPAPTRKKPGFLAGCFGEFSGILAVTSIIVFVLVAGIPWKDYGLSMAGCETSERFPRKVLRWCGWITQSAQEHNLPPDLIAALIWQESGGNPNAISHSGAVGLMQVMPRDGTAEKFQCKGVPCFADRPTMAELRDPEFNIRYGAGLLDDLLEHFDGDLREALRSYGPMDVGYRYADAVLALFERYRQ